MIAPDAPKRLLPLVVLAVLKRHSDAAHRLSQRQIADLLAREHGMVVDRKTLKSALTGLLDCGYRLRHEQVERLGRSGEPEALATGWYLEREFSDLELRLIIDALVFSHQLPPRRRDELIGKLEGLSSRHFHARVKHVKSVPTPRGADEPLLDTVGLLDRAIAAKRRVAFKYAFLGADKKPHLRVSGSTGRPRRYEVSPYQMVASGGYYYLICAAWGLDDLWHFRVDRIQDAAILDQPVRPLKELPGYEDGRLDLPRHLAEHPHMQAGPAVPVRFRVERSSIPSVFDWFGTGPDVRVTDVTDTTADVAVRVNETAMLFWALKFGGVIEVLEPASLRQAMRAAGLAIAEKHRPDS
ncbi:MAG: WYL domain-containing protein [Bifidobacteriaceae bacterium]|jgi:predicted DNA-binding transcriptional regulator YafY|nr:WYL domain-containing protein [Bifidobacteriaceae bacterium]